MTKIILTLTAVAGLIINALAADTIDYKQELSCVTVLEMPAKAAELVKQAGTTDREVVTSAVVNNAAALKPAALPSVVGAIAKSVPEMAATAASVAASAQPKLAVEIARAAAASAPEQALAIVKAVGAARPAQVRDIAQAVSTVVPKDAASKLVALADEISTSSQVVAATENPAPPPRPATVGAPYNPLPPGTPGQGSVTNSGVVPGGGRDYASP
jgi:hypothetical protein